MKEICVVHLVRAQNGIEPFMRFLESYRDNRGDIEHDFLVVFKGFEKPSDKDPYFSLIEPFQYFSFDIPDIGFDITAYFSAAKKYAGQYRFFCFLNSFSVILRCDWLSKLYENIIQPGVGMVGATGSWQSINPWGRILQRRRMRFNKNSTMGLTLCIWDRVKYGLVVIWRYVYFPIIFHPFPNYHLRTNSFMISGEVMMKLTLPTIKTKIDAYKFESGKKSLTRQVLNIGNEVLIVAGDGVGYRMKFWNKSKTFWQADQENLLVADNQTRSYQNAAMEQRRFLSFMAWGIKE
ncbi:MAG: hypothetical protein H7240_11080 [Glaciimonas sp.]|nr:hypothetical protein [Glaciimonas sp.]